MFQEAKKKLHFFKRKMNFQRAVTKEYFQDISLYKKYNGASLDVQNDVEATDYKLAIASHALEKGISLKNIRVFFGLAKIKTAMGLLPKIPKDNFGSLMFNDALSNYLTYHSLTSERPTDLEDLDFGQVKIDLNFPLPLTKRAQFNENRLEFLRSRKSVRDFSEKKIELETLRSAVEVAKFAPSQCNRQTVKLYYTSENSKLKKFLTLQGGANGFSESVPGVVVVASSLKGWLGANQRNQCFVDGGIFAHQLLLSLNASGIDACPLNLAVDNKREIAIKDLLGIPEHMRLIMSIAVGYASQDKVKIAQSRRRHVDDILEIRY